MEEKLIYGYDDSFNTPQDVTEFLNNNPEYNLVSIAIKPNGYYVVFYAYFVKP